MTNFSAPVLHVCVTCSAGEAEAPERPGQRLLAALTAAQAESGAAVEIRPVSCLAACAQGCTAAIFSPTKNFGYLLGHLRPELAADLLAYAKSYAASATGAVMPSRRAASLADAVLARFPAYIPPAAPSQPKEMS